MKSTMKIHDLITKTDDLAALCKRLEKSDFVCVDTEFMRENTYWPELCLIQIGNNIFCLLDTYGKPDQSVADTGFVFGLFRKL